MEYCKAAQHATIDDTVVTSCVELVQYDLALQYANATPSPLPPPQRSPSQRQLLQARLDSILVLQQQQQQHGSLPMTPCTASPQWPHLVLTRDAVLVYKRRQGKHGVKVPERDRPHRQLDLVLQKKWLVVVHDLVYAKTDHRYALVLVRVREPHEIEPDGNGRSRSMGMGMGMGKPPRTHFFSNFKFGANNKQRSLSSSGSLSSGSKSHRQSGLSSSLSTSDSPALSDSTANTSFSSTSSHGSLLLTPLSPCAPAAAVALPHGLIHEPAVLARPAHALETLTMLFQSCNSRRLWQDRLAMYVQRKPVDTGGGHYGSIQTAGPAASPILQLPFTSASSLGSLENAVFQGYSHALFQDLGNLKLSEPVHGGAAAPPPSQASKSRSSSNAHKSKPAPLLLSCSPAKQQLKMAPKMRPVSMARRSIRRTSSLPVAAAARKPKPKQSTPQRQHRSGGARKDKLVKRIDYQATQNFRFGQLGGTANSNTNNINSSAPTTPVSTKSSVEAYMNDVAEAKSEYSHGPPQTYASLDSRSDALKQLAQKQLERRQLLEQLRLRQEQKRRAYTTRILYTKPMPAVPPDPPAKTEPVPTSPLSSITTMSGSKAPASAKQAKQTASNLRYSEKVSYYTYREPPSDTSDGYSALVPDCSCGCSTHEHEHEHEHEHDHDHGLHNDERAVRFRSKESLIPRRADTQRRLNKKQGAQPYQFEYI